MRKNTGYILQFIQLNAMTMTLYIDTLGCPQTGLKQKQFFKLYYNVPGIIEMMSLSKDPAKIMNIRIKSFVGNFALTWIFWLRIFYNFTLWSMIWPLCLKKGFLVQSYLITFKGMNSDFFLQSTLYVNWWAR